MNIALVATGGTIGSRIDDNGRLSLSDAATEQIASVLGACGVFDQFKIQSERMRIPDLNAMRKATQAALDTAPDAVIVSHGTETLAYSAAYLSYAFCSTKIPIVLCSADLPLTDRDSNGFAILNSAKTFVQSRKSGVFVVCKNPGLSPKIHHGARLLPSLMYDDFFKSIGGGAFYDTGLMSGMNFELEQRNVPIITPYVGMDYGCYDLSGCAAAVHTSFRSGTACVDDFNAFAEKHPDTLMFWTTGNSEYRDALAPNIIQCAGITSVALYVKLLIGLNNGIKDLAKFAAKNACGEIAEVKKFI